MFRYRVEMRLIDRMDTWEGGVAAEFNTDGTDCVSPELKLKGIGRAIMRTIREREQANADNG